MKVAVVCKFFSTPLPAALEMSLDDLEEWHAIALQLGKSHGGP